MTVLYNSPIFGPVHSRRLGISLGINLMPADGKICSFDCIYCECGFNKDFRPKSSRPTKEDVDFHLEKTLQQMIAEDTVPDVLTFAGNGEPTGHPDFLEIIKSSIVLRDKYCPKAKVSVLTNGTFIGRENVRKALMLVDNNIVKLDTVNTPFINAVDRPQGHYDIAEQIKNMKAFGGHCIIQTMFMTGEYDSQSVDNTGMEYVLPWLDAVREIAPQQVMIYTIDRETPATQLKKASRECLDAIGDMVKTMGIECSVSY